MPESTPAVFLSYASQDIDAVTRVAEALRARGVVVWLDQNELRGGDQWDNKIRSQIQDCTLFIPFISSNTEIRVEGYFRREWKLADERTHDMGKRRAFIVPVCIDDTANSVADVPDSFLKVQWTRVSPSKNPSDFAQRIANLLEPVISSAPTTTTAASPTNPPSPTHVSPPPSPLRPYLMGVCTLLVVLIGVFLWPKGDDTPISDSPATASPDVFVEETHPAPVIDAAIAAADREKSIAVLPFDNRSRNEDDVFFTEGIHDDLLTQISRIHDIKTISRTSVQAYRDTTKNMREIGEELGVSTLLEGGVQRAGSMVRINVQLIDAVTDAHLWAETYTRELTAENIFAIQSEISEAIADALRAVLSPAEQQRLERLPTGNLAALELYFEAGTLGVSVEDLARKIDLCQQAIELDPDFSLAYSRQAKAVLDQIFYSGLAIRLQVAKATPLVERALQLDPESGEAHAARGRLLYDQKENELAETAYQRALELSPNNAESHAEYALLKAFRLNQPNEAMVLIRRAQELDPESVDYQRFEAEFLMREDKNDEARELLNQLAQDHPDNAQVLRALGQFHAGRREISRALPALRQAHVLDPHSPVICRTIAGIYESIKDTETQVFWLERSFRRTPEEERRLPHRIRVHRHHHEWAAADALWEEFWVTDRKAAKEMLEWMTAEDLNAGRHSSIRPRLEIAYAKWLEPDVKITPNRNDFLDVMTVGSALWSLGERDQATTLFEKLTATVQSPEVPPLFKGLAAAMIATVTLSPDEAMVEVERVAALGMDGVFFLQIPIFDPLHDHPEFLKMFAGDIHWMELGAVEVRELVRELEASGTLAPIPTLPEEAE